MESTIVELRVRIELDNPRFLKLLLGDLNVALREIATKRRATFTYDGPGGDEWVGPVTLTSFASELFASIDTLELSNRVRNTLVRHQVDTVGKLVRMTERELLSITLIGPVAVDEIRGKLGERGMSLQDDV